ncbi:MAG: ImmA/IrrE family metallo-endopeptidase [Rhizobiaceae bacterium]|nr:ImmA/IrrE family metallo-endopeptidase [Rhizobiaceae bacterium]
MSILRELPAGELEIVKEALSEFPVKLGALAKKLGIKVFVATLPAGISGEIKASPNEEDTFIIRVNRHESRPRQRFTLAHEIGHFLLHKDKIGNGIVDDALYRSRLSNSLEYEANRFAADLLMPKAEIDKILDTAVGSDDALIETVCRKFGVSKQAAEIRLGL